MHCKKIRRKLSPYLDGALDETLRQTVTLHLWCCEECREALGRMEGLGRAFSAMSSPPPPPGLAGRILAEARARSTWAWPRSFPLRLATVAGLFIGITAGTIIGLHTWPQGEKYSPMEAQTGAADLVSVFNLDYLTDAPERSLADTYRMLANSDTRW